MRAGDGPAEHCGAQRAAGRNGAVVSVGTFQAGIASNVIPESAVMEAERAGDEAGNPRPADQAYSRAR
ncbi:hypothetical protein LNQ52_01060 [Klebsiella pneumoniae subsp. pneumoniae]|nr:hypothetical protein [Klebsiella pneumoniae subsp. pneumoniae]